MRYRLRTLFAALAIVAVACAAISDVRQRHTAIRKLKALDASSDFRNRIAETLGRPHTIWFWGNPKTSANDLELLDELTSLETVVFDGCFPAQGEDIQLPVTTITRLKHLVLPKYSGDASIKQLGDARQLVFLSAGENVSDEAVLSILGKLDSLTGLALPRAHISNEAIAEFLTIRPNLVFLDLSGRNDDFEHCRLTESTIESLEGVKTLLVQFRELDDKCIDSLSKSRTLTKIYVDQNYVPQLSARAPWYAPAYAHEWPFSQN